MSEELEFSEAYLELVETAMNHALDSISEGGHLVPFVMYLQDGEQQMQRFMNVGETEDEWDLGGSVESAKEFFLSLGGKADAAALALDGRITIDGEKVDAMLVHGFESGMESSYIFGQQYRSADDPEGFEVIGDGLVLAEEEPLW